jgi:hypothetical protein
MQRRIEFFALKSDLLLVLETVEAKRPVKYTLATTSGELRRQEWSRAAEIDGIGFAQGAQTMACTQFLLTNAQTTVQSWRRKEFDGTVHFDVDQRLNPDSIFLTPAGDWNGRMIIAGRIATTSDSPASQALMRLATSRIKKYFTRVRACWVGPEALKQFRAGKRLAVAEQSPALYDLEEED